MTDRRSWRLNIAVGVLLAVGLLLAVAVFSHDPADLDEGVYPLHHTPHNLLGLPGAMAARSLIEDFGAAVYVFLAAWLALVLPLFLRQGWRNSVSRLLGWLLLTPSAAVLADHFGGNWPGGPPAGQGGALGGMVVALADGALRYTSAIRLARNMSVYWAGLECRFHHTPPAAFRPLECEEGVSVPLGCGRFIESATGSSAF